MKPLIDQSFWSDPDIETAKAGVKLTALWLITNSQTSLLGICGASPSRFVFETGLDVKALESTLEALPRAFERFGSVIFVRHYIRHQFGSGQKLMRNNFFVALESLFCAVKDDALRDAILSEYPEFSEASPKGLQGLPKPKDVQERKGKDGEVKEGAGRKHGQKPPREDADAYATEIEMKAEQVQAWFDHFDSNGWRIGGRTPMKDWKASMRTWHRNTATFSRNGSAKPKNTPHVQPEHYTDEAL